MGRERRGGPKFTASIVAVGAVGSLLVVLGDVAAVTDIGPQEGLGVRLIGYAALAFAAYNAMRTLLSQHAELERHEQRLAELLERAEREARTDALTGALNRRALDDAVAGAQSRAERTGVPYSLLLLDVDQLKTVNDQEGHAAGDEALRAVARAATELIRGYDVVARVGGDEFVVLLHEADDAVARRTAGRIEQRARDQLAGTRTTVSVGTATWHSGATADELLAEADRRMYAVKRERGAAR